MYLPDWIQKCISSLENAGFAAYAVGGCVRDSLLGLSPQDYDLCANALPEQTKAVFRDYRLVLAGEKHGTVTVVTPEGNVEITTFRTDGVVYYGNFSYRIKDSALLSEYLAFFERIKAASDAEGTTSGDIPQEQFDAYQQLFDAPSWYAQAVASPFTDRAVNLNNMFYDGLSYDENGVPVYGGFVTAADGDEWAWVQENVPGATETDVSRLPRDGMYQVLRDTLYGETPIPDDLAPEGWTYWDKTDCWYHAHGDTGINSVTLSYASLDGGGTGYFQFENAFGQICSIGFVLGQTEADAGHVYLRYCIAQ